MANMTGSLHHSNEVVIKPPAQSKLIDIRELLRFRGLLWSMARRQVKAEFGDLHLGIFWVLARPLLMTVIFVFFKNVLNTRTGGSVPYTAYLYSGLILWFFFAEATALAAKSIGKDKTLMQKIYFPRLLSPLSSIVAKLSGFALSFIPLALIMIYYGLAPGLNLMLLPIVLLQTMLLALGVGCLFAAVGTLSLDWDRLLGLLLYIGIFVSPVIFLPEMLPKVAQSIHMLNPMSGALLGFRAALFSNYALPLYEWLYSLAFSGVFGLVGVYAFQRAERTFMDRI